MPSRKMIALKLVGGIPLSTFSREQKMSNHLCQHPFQSSKVKAFLHNLDLNLDPQILWLENAERHSFPFWRVDISRGVQVTKECLNFSLKHTNMSATPRYTLTGFDSAPKLPRQEKLIFHVSLRALFIFFSLALAVTSPNVDCSSSKGSGAVRPQSLICFRVVYDRKKNPITIIPFGI